MGRQISINEADRFCPDRTADHRVHSAFWHHQPAWPRNRPEQSRRAHSTRWSMAGVQCAEPAGPLYGSLARFIGGKNSAAGAAPSINHLTLHVFSKTYLRCETRVGSRSDSGH